MSCTVTSYKEPVGIENRKMTQRVSQSILSYIFLKETSVQRSAFLTDLVFQKQQAVKNSFLSALSQSTQTIMSPPNYKSVVLVIQLVPCISVSNYVQINRLFLQKFWFAYTSFILFANQIITEFCLVSIVIKVCILLLTFHAVVNHTPACSHFRQVTCSFPLVSEVQMSYLHNGEKSSGDLCILMLSVPHAPHSAYQMHSHVH